MTKNKVFIVAEIGKNFIQTEKELSVEEYLTNAKVLVDKAKEAGADAVKFQTHVLGDEQLNVKVISPHFRGADRYSWVKRNATSTPYETFWEPLKRYCDNIGITFFSTPMSRSAAKLLNKLKVKLWKIGSGDVLDFVTLDYIAQTKKPLIISSGMTTLAELDKAVNFLKKRQVKFTLLHCVSRYPCPPEDLNLATMIFLKDRYLIPVGFSDHSLRAEPSLAAVYLGACVIEKHFSLSRDLWGADHKASLTPIEFKKLVDSIRQLESQKLLIDKKTVQKYLGKTGKYMQEKEAVFRPYFRKSLMAGCDIEAGTIIKPEMVYAMRPQAFAKGLPSEDYEKVLGKRISKNLNKYDPLTWNCFK